MRLLPQLSFGAGSRSSKRPEAHSGRITQDVSKYGGESKESRSEAQAPANRSPGGMGTMAGRSPGSSRVGGSASPPAFLPSSRKPQQDFTFGRIYPIIPNKLSFVAQRSEKLSPEQQRAVQSPNGPEYVLLNCEFPKQYFAFCHDFGPTNLGVLYRFCEYMRGKLKWAQKMQRSSNGLHLVMRFSQDAKIRTNCAFLVSAFLMLEEGYSVEEALAPFMVFHPYPFLEYRDVTTGESSFDLSLKDCLDGVQKAVKLGWFDLQKFDISDYEHWDEPQNGDMHLVCPKFIAFKGPQTDAHGNPLHESEATHYIHEPRHYFRSFRKKGVSAIVRLNEPDTYRADNFRVAGFTHHDLYFDDCSTPSDAIARQFIRLADQTDGVVAVHCKAGLGRTGCLIAAYIMERHGFTAREAIAWLRIARPGMVIGPQQNYLEDYERTIMAGINQGGGRYGSSDGVVSRVYSDPTHNSSNRRGSLGRAAGNLRPLHNSPAARSTDAVTAQSAQEMAEQVWAGSVIRNKRREGNSGALRSRDEPMMPRSKGH
mmetsp:Transcript_12378/g.19513  ORF Transcript_12378/g.19513 Transcript_12378/m.19513 type:complete len:538 (+) Transcript_12378:223-1836(+)|eukprot:CAMPEP_0184310474 /NCGR_PEP_ID=MMETSP1049-20130417/30998_1 /TAXON_ID=77928 /ORGANISM="Proteomonas sulcata, Strain CCMP704" /LENGTH=537 /DNA_ID=CAMNT_0026624695 /DNA_START=237 /DNA_END=1850 /DNA_ORIENTATION=-